MPPTPRSQGPRKRTDKTGGLDRRLIGIGVVAVLVAVAVVLAVVLSGGGDGSSGGGGEDAARTALEEAGCVLEIVPGVKADHSVATPDGSSPKWNTFPPTSGPHYGDTVIYGSYTEPIEQARGLHNLEHGAVFIQYGSRVPESTVSELQDFYGANATGTILAPLPRLGDTIALTAWNAPDTTDPGRGVLATCTTFDEQAYAAYLDAFQFQGPERISPSSLTPGSK